MGHCASFALCSPCWLRKEAVRALRDTHRTPQTQTTFELEANTARRAAL
jgi:hypothetical protein